MKLAALAVALLAAAGCASGSSGSRARCGGPGLALGSSAWCPSRSNDVVPEDRMAWTSRTGMTPPIAPSSPWLGEIGLRQRIAASSELGCGIAVPNSMAASSREPALADRVREFGVGLWWKLDF